MKQTKGETIKTYVCYIPDETSSELHNVAKECYLKSEVDKVIAELEEKHKTEVKELLCLIRDKENNFNRAFDSEEKELRHRKRKWCLAMAKWCKRKCIDAANYIIPREMWDFYDKWHKRWLAIAEKFKEAK